MVVILSDNRGPGAGSLTYSAWLAQRWMELMRFLFMQLTFLMGISCCMATAWSGETPRSTTKHTARQLIGEDRAESSTIGPFELSGTDGRSRIRFQFASQLRLFFESAEPDSGEHRSESLFMEARRIRLVLTGSVLDPALSFRFHLSTAPHSLELMDYYLNYAISPQLQFRFGQYKVPFTRYRIQSFQQLTFVDWAIVTKYFGAERQMGLAWHNGYEKPPPWAYVVGAFTGVNARASHNTGLARLFDRELSNPSDLSNPSAKAEYHPELFLHAAFNANGIAVRSDSDENGGGLRTSVGLSAAWDLGPVAGIDYTLRLSPEILVKYNGVSASGIAYAGFTDVGNSPDLKLAISGALIQTAYRINGHYELSIRYAVADFADAVIDDARAATVEPSFDRVVREEEVCFGFNLYLIGHNLKLQNDVGRLKRSYVEETRIDYITRSQFQIAF